MIGPAVVDDHGMIGHVEIPVVIAVVPSTAAVELGAGTGEQLHGKTVSVATVIRTAVSLCVSILVGVAVDDLVVAAVGVAGIELGCAADGERLGLLNLPVLIHTNLQTGVVVIAEGAALHDVVRALHLHTVVLGMLQRQSVESPVVGQMVNIDTTGLLEGNF